MFDLKFLFPSFWLLADSSSILLILFHPNSPLRSDARTGRALIRRKLLLKKDWKGKEDAIRNAH